MKRYLTGTLIGMLIGISANVAIGLMLHLDMWPFIVAYWVVLTIKNIVDLIIL